LTILTNWHTATVRCHLHKYRYRRYFKVSKIQNCTSSSSHCISPHVSCTQVVYYLSVCCTAWGWLDTAETWSCVP